MIKKEEIPSGYMKNAQGGLTPLSLVKPIEIARNEFVNEVVADALRVAGEIANFKKKALGDIAAFIELSAEQHGVTMGGVKGNVSLRSYDGEYKIERAVNENLVFDEQLQVAKVLIDGCFHRWTENSCPEVQVLINDAFKVDQAGQINTGRVLGLRRLDIKDKDWQKAMNIIGESLQVDGSKTYIRIYKRGKDGKYEHVSLDVAS